MGRARPTHTRHDTAARGVGVRGHGRRRRSLGFVARAGCGGVWLRIENATRETVQQVSVWLQCRDIVLDARNLDAHACTTVCMCDCRNVDPRRSRGARRHRSLCGFNAATSSSMRAISTHIGARQCACVIALRGDPRARAGAAHVRIGVSECGP